MSKLVRRNAARCAVIAFVCLGVLSATPAFSGDAFLRAGIIFQPRDIGFEGRWRVAFGSDYAVNFSETLYAGFEVQTSVFRQDVLGRDFTATLVPMNGFANVKYKGGSIGFRPYGGGGVGILSTIVFVSGGNDWSNEVGFHILGGVEAGSFSIELEIQRAFESGFATQYSIYAGFVW